VNAVRESLTSIEQKMASFGEECRRAGLKLTYQRLEIYRDMAFWRDHPSAEVIYSRIRTRIPTISLDTVYRTLANFEAHGLINRIQTVESQAHYEADLEQHHHLICERCGKIMDFVWQALDDLPVPDAVIIWGKVNSTRVTLQGICVQCAKTGR